MIHDILLTLLNPNANNLTIENFLGTDYVSVFLHPCERKIMEEILEIYHLHREISKFTQFYSSGIYIHDINNEDETEEYQKSLYLQAFANGIENALQTYTDEIVDLEKRYLLSPSFTLLFIFHKINAFQPLFIYFQRLIRGIKTQQIHGCAIIQYLYKNMLSGSHEVHLAAQTVQSSVNIVFLKHLTHWLLYAKMHDSYGEFFIQHIDSQNNSGKSNLENEYGKQTVNSFSEVVSTYADIWRYEICYEFLPHFITPSIARKILFIGQTVLMFKMDAAKKRLELWNQPVNQQFIEDSIWNNNEHEYFKKIQCLQCENNLTVSHFDILINEIKLYITGRLSQIAVKQADLVHQLKLIKDFYLLGRGELFLEFIKRTEAIDSSYRTENIVRDIVVAFESAAGAIGLTEELEQFSLTLPKENFTDSDDKNLPYFHYISLQYKIIWPLHLLFSPKVIECYNELFRFLLQIKRLQYDLHMIWCINRETKTKPNFSRLHLRNQFMFFIDNLQYYIQADVLESQYSILMNIVNDSSDFEEIQRAHSVFQANIMSLCFLLGNDNIVNTENSLTANNSVLIILQELFAKCEIFCNLEKNSEENKDKSKEQYEFLELRLKELIEQLMNLLFTLKSAPSSTPLSQLLLRLDYNNWFCKDWKKRNESI